MLEIFLKIPPRKYQNFKTERRLQNKYKKETFKPEIKPMTENFQDKLYQLENKQAKAKLGAIFLQLIVGGQRVGYKVVILDKRWRAKNTPKLGT